MEFIHKDTYPTALDLTKYFVSKSEVRPILMYTYHAPNGDLVACDTHTMLVARNCHGFSEDLLINPRTFMAAKGKYIDYKKIVADTDAKLGTIELSVEDLLIWRQMHRSMNQLAKGTKEKFGIIQMRYDGENLQFEVEGAGVSFNLPFVAIGATKTFTVRYRIEHMRNCLNAHVALNDKKNGVVIKMASPMAPVVVEQADVVTMLTPIRPLGVVNHA